MKTKHTRAELAEMAEQMPAIPGDLDDLRLANVLLDVLVAEQRKITMTSAAVLLALVGSLTRRAIDQMPKPAQCLLDGTPVFSVEDIARLAGLSPEEVAQVIRDMGDEADQHRVDPRDVRPLN